MMTRPLSRGAVALAAVCVVGALPAAAQVSTPQILVLTGDAAPSGNGSFSTFQSPALNNQGRVAFNASLSGSAGGSADDRGIFRAGSSSLTVIVREGDGAPDGNGTISSFPNPPIINDAGQVALALVLTGTSGGPTDDRAIFLGDGSTLLTIAREGQAEPGGDGSFSTISTIRGLALNGAGQVAFHSNLTGTSGGGADDEGVYRGDGSALTAIVREGEPDLDGPAGGTFASLNSDPTLNDSGQVGFHGIVSAPSGNTWNMYRGDGATRTTIAREGALAPDGTFLIIDTRAAIDDAGRVTFDATLDGTQGGPADDAGLFSSVGGGVIDTIAREGDLTPGGPGALSDFLLDFASNDVGSVAFTASLSGVALPGTQGIFRAGPSSPLVEVARSGQVAPGGTDSFTFLGPPALNLPGQVAFLGVASDGRGGSSSLGIYLFDDVLGLVSVATEGDALLGSTITSLGFGAGDPPSEEGSGLNDFGQVAYAFTLADGREGIAMKSVPEPSTRVLLLVGCLALSVCAMPRRRRRPIAPLAPQPRRARPPRSPYRPGQLSSVSR